MLTDDRGKRQHDTRHLAYCALFIAAGIILPLFFHFVSLTGQIFLPMHIPVLLGGLLLGKKDGFAVGLVTPLLSALLTGMPPLSVLPLMAVELALYGFFSGLLFKDAKLSCRTSLFGAMLLGRVGEAVILFAFGSLLGIQLAPFAYLLGTVSKGLIGIVIQLLLIPVLVRPLKKLIHM